MLKNEIMTTTTTTTNISSDDAKIIAAAMAILGRIKTPKKTASCRANLAKLRATGRAWHWPKGKPRKIPAVQSPVQTV